MERRDYLIQQAEQLGQVLGKILCDLLRIKTQGVVRIDYNVFNTTLTDALDFNLDQILPVPAEQFLNTLRVEKNYSNDNLEQLANILFLISDDLEPAEQLLLSEKCLCIFDYLDKTWNTYSFDRNVKIEILRKRLKKEAT